MSKEHFVEELGHYCLVHEAMLNGRHHSPRNRNEAFAFDWHKQVRLLFGFAQSNQLDDQFRETAKKLHQQIGAYLEATP